MREIFVPLDPCEKFAYPPGMTEPDRKPPIKRPVLFAIISGGSFLLLALAIVQLD
ncbi:MAG: hypothetical protein GDA39_01430 [Hyphomonadaceae bacterium]|nr:hypothetical protein [Hyphomonadaceae bacterium]